MTSYRVWRDEPKPEHVKQASEARMQLFDKLPEHLRAYANEHGLNKAIQKLRHDQAQRS